MLKFLYRSGKRRYSKGNYDWRDPFFTPMIMGGRVSQNKFKTNYLEEILEIKTWTP